MTIVVLAVIVAGVWVALLLRDDISPDTPIALPTRSTEPSAEPATPPAGRVVLRDSFDRPDADELETAPTGQEWRGSGGALPVIRDGRVVASDRGSAYAMVDVGARPSMLQVTGSWDDARGAGTTSGVTMIASTDPNFSLRKMVHFNLTPAGWVLQVGDKDALETIASGGLDLATDGTEYTWAMHLEGDTATLALPGGSVETVTDPRIAEYSGEFCIYEVSAYEGEAASRVDAAVVSVRR